MPSNNTRESGNRRFLYPWDVTTLPNLHRPESNEDDSSVHSDITTANTLLTNPSVIIINNNIDNGPQNNIAITSTNDRSITTTINEPPLNNRNDTHSDTTRQSTSRESLPSTSSSSPSSSSSTNATSNTSDDNQSESIKKLKEEISKRQSSQRGHSIRSSNQLSEERVNDFLQSRQYATRRSQLDTNNYKNNRKRNLDNEDNESNTLDEDVDMDSETTNGASNILNNNNDHYSYPENLSKPIVQDFFTTKYKPRASSVLRPFSSFIGSQQSGRSTYEVRVDLKEVDLKRSYICGFLTIHGLTKTHPEITTFFKGEIIGPHYSFYTMNEKWGSNPKNDLQHWGRFPSWRNLEFSTENDCENSDIYKNYLSNEFLYMRWKEVFLVPDAEVKDITGASFAGFYYVCFNQLTGSISGLYFHKCSDKFQQLELAHIPDGGCFASYEYQ